MVKGRIGGRALGKLTSSREGTRAKMDDCEGLCCQSSLYQELLSSQIHISVPSANAAALDADVTTLWLLLLKEEHQVAFTHT